MAINVTCKACTTSMYACDVNVDVDTFRKNGGEKYYK